MSALCPRHVRLVPQYNGGLEYAQWKAVCGILLGNATADCWTPYEGGLKVVMGCDWWCRVIGECNCRLLDALSRWAQGGHGLQLVVPCYWGMQLQIARRLIMVRLVVPCYSGECNCSLLDAL